MTTTIEPSAPHERQTVRTRAARLAADRFAASNAVAERFFADHANAIAHACRAMAERFQRGGRMFVCGDGAQRSDVAHVVVEFVHPVVVGKRALPTLPLPEIERGGAGRMLVTLGRSGDLLLVLSAGGLSDAAREILAAAHAAGLLTIACSGSAHDAAVAVADHRFAVPSSDACIVQETHELLYHVLWELVHVFFDHRGVKT